MSFVTKTRKMKKTFKNLLTKRNECGRIYELPLRQRDITKRTCKKFKKLKKVLKNLLTSGNESDIIDRLSQKRVRSKLDN